MDRRSRSGQALGTDRRMAHRGGRRRPRREPAVDARARRRPGRAGGRALQPRWRGRTARRAGATRAGCGGRRRHSRRSGTRHRARQQAAGRYARFLRRRAHGRAGQYFRRAGHVQPDLPRRGCPGGRQGLPRRSAGAAGAQAGRGQDGRAALRRRRGLPGGKGVQGPVAPYPPRPARPLRGRRRAHPALPRRLAARRRGCRRHRILPAGRALRGTGTQAAGGRRTTEIRRPHGFRPGGHRRDGRARGRERPTTAADPALEARRLLAEARRRLADRPRERAQLDECARRLDEPLRVALAGSIKAGKSTLLNALVGQDIAPTDATECTRLVTWYRHGGAPGVDAVAVDGAVAPVPVRRGGGAHGLTFDLSAPAWNRPGPHEVDHLEVRWPAATLAGLTLVDTPGTSSLSREVSRRTARLLAPEADERDPVPVPGADAVVYLLRRLDAADMDLLERLGGGD